MNAESRRSFRPLDFQPDLPLGNIILHRPPSEDSVSFDVLFVGAGPASLAGAIKLAQLVRTHRARAKDSSGDISIGVIEKSAAVGHHVLSGAIVNPNVFQELFPELSLGDIPFEGPVRRNEVYLLTRNAAIRLPAPPTMHNKGYYVASLCQIVRWLAEKASALGVEILTGFPARSLLVQGIRVVGVQTADAGRDRAGSPLPNFQPGTDIAAKAVVLGEGTRGYLTQAYLKWQDIRSPNPQIYAQGVKEVWQIQKPLDAVVHTMGWPLDSNTFGGSFFYPMRDNHVAIGLVVGLDYTDASLDVHQLLQELKTHPFFRHYLEGGQLVEWGAKTIPEGGYWSLPARLSGDGLLLVGDSAGFVDAASLKGVHYAMTSGILAAKTLFEAWEARDFSAASLCAYDQHVQESFIYRHLYERRNMRLAFKDGLWLGALKAGLFYLTHGLLFGRRIPIELDSHVVRHWQGQRAFLPDRELTFGKLDAVNRAGNATRDNIPSHLLAEKDVGRDLAEFYSHVCPAGVYEVVNGSLHINPSNCIDCKATDILAPRWSPREGGSGPKYTRM